MDQNITIFYIDSSNTWYIRLDVSFFQDELSRNILISKYKFCEWISYFTLISHVYVCQKIFLPFI
jgi:hypothetical protein